jgi:hypothetical protein
VVDETRSNDEALQRCVAGLRRPSRVARAFSGSRVIAFVALVLCAGPSECGLESGTKDVGAACTRDGECLPGLVCARGVCSEPADGDMDPDAG